MNMMLSDFVEKKSKFLKLEKGVEKVLYFPNPISRYYSVFKDPNKYETWEQGRSVKFDTTVLDLTDPNNPNELFFTFGNTLKKKLVDLVKEHGSNIKVSVKKDGEGLSTTYSVKFAGKVEGNTKPKTSTEVEDVGF